MTKLQFESDPIETKVIAKLDNTYYSLLKIELLDNAIRIPRGYNATKYNDAIKKLRKINKGLTNIKKDLKRAVNNYESCELKCKRNNKKFNSDYKMEQNSTIINVK